MPLEDILKKIDEETRKQEEEIIRDAQRRADEIIKEAENKAASIREEYTKRAKEEAELIKKQMISAAILENRNRYEVEIENIQNHFLYLMNEKLREFVNSEYYDKYLNEKIRRGWELLGPGALIYVNPRDKQKVQSLSFPLNIIEKNIDPIGGVILTSADGKIEVDYTFSEMIRDRADQLRGRIRKYIIG